MKDNSIKNERSSIEEDITELREMIENANIENMDMNDCFGGEHIEAIEHILSNYKKLQEEFKQVDHECERLEVKEVKLIKENEYYKDLINALETYYEITREDLEKCMKNDR